jgi:hypothetical protein
MMLIYIITACLVGALVNLLAGMIFKNRIVTFSLTIFIMAAAIFIVRDYGVPHYYAYTFASSIRDSSPLVDFIASNSPDDFNNYVAKVKQNILHNQDPQEVYLDTNMFINLELRKQIPNATNESIYNYLSACVEMDKNLYKINPSLVLYIEYPEKFLNKIDLSSIYQTIDPVVLNNLVDAKQRIIKSGFLDNMPKMSLSQRMDANLMFANIMSGLSLQYGRRNMLGAFANPDDPSVNQQVAAQIIISYYEDILSKGKDNAGMIYKSLFSGN